MKPDLSTRYLGLALENPLVVSACPLTSSLESLQAIEAAGAGAAVLPSLFEEQIEHHELEMARLYDFQADMTHESLSYFPELDRYNTGPERYLQLVRSVKRQLKIPVIASLNGASRGGWLAYAAQIAEAGADALELNIYLIPTDPQQNSMELEDHYLELVSQLRKHLKIPLAVKLGPYFSALPSFARRLNEAGADGLVLFNRYLAPAIDLENLTFMPALELSHPAELRLTLRWIAILRDQLRCSLAATGGVHQVGEVVQALLVGADVVMMASTLLKHGVSQLSHLKIELTNWLTLREYHSVTQLRGSMSFQHCSHPEGLLRANYLQALTAYTSKP